jgi:hypothetical protein
MYLTPLVPSGFDQCAARRACSMVDQPTNGKTAMPQSGLGLASYNDIPVADLLYKYYCYHAPDKNEWTHRIFKHNEIYFAAPKDFNDPFDSIQRFVYPTSPEERQRFIREWVRRVSPEIPEPIADRQVRGSVEAGDDIPHMEGICETLTHQMQQSNAVFCMTTKNDNILMWAHYAGQHTGFCLEFRTDNPLFSRARPVIYCRSLPKQNLIEFLTADIRGLPLYLVTKAEDWVYEKEWRLADPGPEPGPRKYPPESLTGVILGCRMDERNREQVKEWCREREPRPTLYVAKEKKSEYGLDIIPISY